ncbi:anti-anti-sigma factor [Edaphobacter aggregans]|uniref:Anti-sigma factor antagonist n=1 Tax=Edaphobacter aggregans TaxID=570835 RepID=A0A3R9PSU0_9BACT|nr:STAS domain-containing protein [Edaphobacter aggregans]RSL17145.1 anti-anti-sigma factor [Edaphobacter aggregans]
MMQTNHAQVWKSTPFTIERKEGKAPGTVIFRLCGPFTARDMFGTLAPIGLLNILSFQSTPSEELPALNILDLTDVPYMDSTGLGRIVSHYVHCRGKGVRMIIAGASPRVVELFRLTKVDSTIPMAPTVEEADIQ